MLISFLAGGAVYVYSTGEVELIVFVIVVVIVVVIARAVIIVFVMVVVTVIAVVIFLHAHPPTRPSPPRFLRSATAYSAIYPEHHGTRESPTSWASLSSQMLCFQ